MFGHNSPPGYLNDDSRPSRDENPTRVDLDSLATRTSESDDDHPPEASFGLSAFDASFDLSAVETVPLSSEQPSEVVQAPPPPLPGRAAHQQLARPRGPDSNKRTAAGVGGSGAKRARLHYTVSKDCSRPQDLRRDQHFSAILSGSHTNVNVAHAGRPRNPPVDGRGKMTRPPKTRPNKRPPPYFPYATPPATVPMMRPESEADAEAYAYGEDPKRPSKRTLIAPGAWTGVTSYWSVPEQEQFPELLARHGRAPGARGPAPDRPNP